MAKDDAKAKAHRWEFKPRFRRHAFGWKSQPAIQRVKQAVSEIKKVARMDQVLAAEGAVAFFERISPAIELVDSSSGAIGTSVSHAIEALVPIIATASVDLKTRAGWLERLWVAHEADKVPYIEQLGDYWGELCGSQQVADEWADRLLDITSLALSPDPEGWAYFHGTTACLSALFRAERYQEIIDLVSIERLIWSYKRWAVRAIAAMGKVAEAIEYAEECRGPWTPEGEVDALCEDILLTGGLADEAYQRYGVRRYYGGTYLTKYRSVARKYPHKEPGEILADLVKASPGDEGKWFAAAKEAGLHDEALALADRTPCDPKTLTRAARDFATERPAFAARAGYLALRWLAAGYGYEITGADVLAAYECALKAAKASGEVGEMRARIEDLLATNPNSFAAQILARKFE